MQRVRMQQTMPEDKTGWHLINAGPDIEILFHPDRRPVGREPDQIERPSIVVAVAGKREQALRFDPFSMGAHYHIRPGLADQIPLPVAEGQSPLDATMASHSLSRRGKARSMPQWHSLRSRFGSVDSWPWPRRTEWRRNCAMRS